MRKYKFRCWYRNKMRYDITGFEFYGEGNLSGVFIDGDFADEIELMQFTGLHDKNRKEIYEGDIIQDECCIYEVYFQDGSFRAEVIKVLVNNVGTQKGLNYTLEFVLETNKGKIIGNIYENSDLLKGADNI